MNKKCANCGLVNFPDTTLCARCQTALDGTATAKRPARTRKSGFLVRSIVCVTVCIAVVFGFYLSLIGSARSLSLEQKSTVREAIAVLEEKGFADEAMMLNNFTAFRSDDNWLNASVAKESAYAATNFPFEIVTLYPDFFAYPADDTERAAILLHEARHLLGKEEKDAYEFVWKNRSKLGWTRDKYSSSPVWRNIRQQTRDNVPNLFVCDFNEYSDCTE